MQLNQMVYQMCSEVLAAVDMNAIRKARGFSQAESASRSVFENAFLSGAGLSGVMAGLSTAETAALHLLAQQPLPVEIKFFERLYGNSEEDHPSLTTYSQRYRSTLDAVKKNLVRKGVLVMFEHKNIPETVQMERWRFMLPPAFARYLPTLIAKPHLSNDPGITRDRLWVEKAREGLGAAPVSALTARGPYQVNLEHGTLLLGSKLFQASVLKEWQLETWSHETNWNVKTRGDYDEESLFVYALTPIEALLKILGSLEPGQWVSAGQLVEPLRIFAAGIDRLQPEKLCRDGWKWGCLARLSEEGETYYRLAASYQTRSTTKPEQAASFASWLTALPGENSALRVQLENASLTGFELLNALAHLSSEQDLLLARPDPVKLGRCGPELRQSALANWLREQWPAFAEALAQVEQRWGRAIVHQGLLVARVRDLSLRVQIERELKDQVVVLSPEFIAFPPGLRADVERLLKKGGFVVKEVRA